MADVFVSYAREDETRVAALVHLLEANGLSVFWDRRIAAGATWRETIGRALAEARCVVVAWSRHSIASSFVAEEADDARERGILVPVLLDAVQPPLGFRSLQAADMVDLGPSETPAGFESVLSAVRAVLAATAASPRATPPIRVAAKRPRSQAMFVAMAVAAGVVGAIGWGSWKTFGPKPAPQAAAARVELSNAAHTAPNRQRPTVELVRVFRPEGGGTKVTVRVESGAAPFEFDPSTFKLKRRDGSLQPGHSAGSAVFMETLQPNSSKEYALGFDSADGVALIVPGDPARTIALPSAKP